MLNPEKGMTLIVKEVTRLTVGLIFLFGIYVMLYEQSSPGGGFPGGVIVALSFIHLILAFGGDYVHKKIKPGEHPSLAKTADKAYLLMAIMGLIVAATFFLNFFSRESLYELPREGVVPVLNLAIGLKVGSGLFLLFAVLTIFKPGGSE